MAQHALLPMALAAFALTVLFVNPVRETAVEDDWAYALTVQHLLDTGTYQLHDWAAANMPFQICWGGVLAGLLGYSFSSLRISTLLLAFVGLIAFYFLAMEHGLNRSQAGLLTFGLLSSPLFLRWSFTFMTDIPFLVCLIISLLLYAKALRLQSYPLMLLASTAASAAILTRQLGIALIAGVFLLWASSKQRRRHVFLFLTGLALPTAAGLWQLSTAILTPNWGTQYAAYAQSQYIADPVLVLSNILWRPTVIAQYVALFSLPFVVPALLGPVVALRQGRLHSLEHTPAKPDIILVLCLAVYTLAGIIYGHLAKGLPWLMPYLPWTLEILVPYPLARGILTLLTSIGAVMLSRAFVLRLPGNQGWRRVPAGHRLLDLVALFMLIFYLVNFQIWQRYLLVFLPLTLIAVGRHLRALSNRVSILSMSTCLAMLLASAMWTRGLLSWEEAVWAGGEFLRSIGVQPQDIDGSWTWMGHYRFQDYVTEVGGRAPRDAYDFLDRWLPEQREQARFRILGYYGPPADEIWEVLKELPYRDHLLREKRIYVIRRAKVNLLYGEESDFARWEPTVRNILLGRARASVLVIDEGLAGSVGVGGLTPPEWGEEYPGEFLWLGQGDEQGIKAALWSDQELMVELGFDVTPGPGRPDGIRTVDLTLENESGVQRDRQQFDRTTTVSFVVQLQPGRNVFTFGCLDEATVLEQPNGDTRPLLVRLDAIRVASLFNRGQAGPADSPLVTLDPNLRGVVGILSHLETPPWDVEVYDDGSLLWLGHGDEQGIKAVLWSDQELMVELAFDVTPGPGRADPLRTVYLTLENESGVQRERQQFDTTTTVSFVVQLQPGRNEFTFGCLDEATVLEQPNGDTRPLLVLLRQIRIED